MQSPWDNFPYEEMSCKCGRCDSDGTEMDPIFMGHLQDLRDELGFALPLSSAYRCRHHPVEAKKDKPGTHNMGVASDIKCSRKKAHRVLKAAMTKGVFTGIGIKQKGNKRFIHLDTAPPAAHRPRPHVWSY